MIVTNCYLTQAGGGTPTAPGDIAGLSFWYDVQDLGTMWQDVAGTTPAAVNVAVARIDDKSGHGYNLTNASSAGWPILRQSGALYYLEPDGTNDSLTNSSTNIPCATVLATGMIRASADGTDSNAGFITNRSDQGSDVDFALARDGTFNRFSTNQGAGLGLCDSTHVWVNQVQTNNYSTTNVQVYSADGTGHPGSLRFPTGISLFSDRQLSSRHPTGRLYELFAYDSILSTSDRQAMENYMAARYGLTF